MLQEQERQSAELIDGAILILLQKGWTNGNASEARDTNESPVQATSPRAVKFTPYGAIRKVGAHRSDNMAQWGLAVSWLKLWVQKTLDFDGLYSWNNAVGQNVESVVQVMTECAQFLRDPNHPMRPLSGQPT